MPTPRPDGRRLWSTEYDRQSAIPPTPEELEELKAKSQRWQREEIEKSFDKLRKAYKTWASCLMVSCPSCGGRGLLFPSGDTCADCDGRGEVPQIFVEQCIRGRERFPEMVSRELKFCQEFLDSFASPYNRSFFDTDNNRKEFLQWEHMHFKEAINLLSKDHARDGFGILHDWLKNDRPAYLQDHRVIGTLYLDEFLKDKHGSTVDRYAERIATAYFLLDRWYTVTPTKGPKLSSREVPKTNRTTESELNEIEDFINLVSSRYVYLDSQDYFAYKTILEDACKIFEGGTGLAALDSFRDLVAKSK